MIQLYKRFQLYGYSFFMVSVIALRSFFTRKRFSHDNGIAARGTFTVTEDLEITYFASFRPGAKMNVLMRHASLAFYDDAALVTRGASIKFLTEKGESFMDVQMNSGHLPPFWSVRSFITFTGAAARGGGEHYGKLFKKYPMVRDAFISDVKRMPGSFAELYYRNRPATILHATDGEDYYVKYQLAPENYGPDKWQARPVEQQTIWDQHRPTNITEPVDYLKNEFKNRLVKGPIRYHFRIQLFKVSEAQDAEVLNPLYNWDEAEHPWITLGTVELTEYLSEEESAKTRFSLSHQPEEVDFIKAKSIDDYNSLNYIRLMGEKAQQARFLGYRLFGMPKAISHKPYSYPNSKPEETKEKVMNLTVKEILKYAAVFALIVIAGWGLYQFYFPNLPKSVSVSDVVHLNTWKQDSIRQKYYHTDQGSRVMPYRWFVNIENLGSSKTLFNDPENLSRFRLLFDPYTDSLDKSGFRLPIGFAITPPDLAPGQGPVTDPVLKDELKYVGLSCATCHTGQLNYKGVGLRIDGGSGMVDVDAFLADMIKSLALTISPFRPAKFDRFAKRIYGEEVTDEDKKKLKRAIEKYIAGQALLKIQEGSNSGKKTPAGFGRIDALGQGGNALYRNFGTSNLATLDAPVGVPVVWYTNQYDWVQLNGSIRQPLSRNIIEALAVNARVTVPGSEGYRDENDLYFSNIRVEEMASLEESLKHLKAPEWPEEILGEIDLDRAVKGRALYKEKCANCHAKQYEKINGQEENWSYRPGDPRNKYYDYAMADQYKGNYFKLRLFDVNEIGTDPVDAVNFAERTVKLEKKQKNTFFGLWKERVEQNKQYERDYNDANTLLFGGKETVPGATIISKVIGGVVNRKMAEAGYSESEQARLEDYRSPLWRAPKAYPARPLAGIWTSAPYLHNNSVPTLYEFLSPVEERKKEFWTGDLEFNPKEVGYLHEKFSGATKIDTRIRGNDNGGHEFTNNKTYMDGKTEKDKIGVLGDRLTEEQRWEIIEYLKGLHFYEEGYELYFPESEYAVDLAEGEYCYNWDLDQTSGVYACYDPFAYYTYDPQTRIFTDYSYYFNYYKKYETKDVPELLDKAYYLNNRPYEITDYATNSGYDYSEDNYYYKKYSVSFTVPEGVTVNPKAPNM